jgi:hypothetical protein
MGAEVGIARREHDRYQLIINKFFYVISNIFGVSQRPLLDCIRGVPGMDECPLI